MLRPHTMPCLVLRLVAGLSESTTLHPVITAVVDAEAVADVEALMTVDEEAVVDVADSMTEDVEVAEVVVVAVEAAPTVGALEISKARSRLSNKSLMAMPRTHACRTQSLILEA